MRLQNDNYGLHEALGVGQKLGRLARQTTEEMIERAQMEGRRFRLLDEGDIDQGAVEERKHFDPDEHDVCTKGLIWTADEPGGDADFGPLCDFGG